MNTIVYFMQNIWLFHQRPWYSLKMIHTAPEVFFFLSSPSEIIQKLQMRVLLHNAHLDLNKFVFVNVRNNCAA